MQEDVINGRDDAVGQYKRDRAQGGQYKRGGGGRIVQEDITEGRDGAEGGQYKREG